MRRSEKAISIILALLVSSLLIQACGFKLRGSVAFRDELAPVLIKDLGGVSQIAPVLREAILSQGIAVVNESSQANSIVNLMSERFDRNVLTVSNAGQVQKYALTYSAEFFVNSSDDTELLKKSSVYVERVLRFDEAELSAKAAEAGVLQKSMLQDASRQILRQMEYIDSVSQK